jgi:SAM-dependent methyltransferase
MKPSSVLKAFLLRYFPWLHETLVRYRAKRMPRSDLFAKIYRENGWNDSESSSGLGSRMDETRNIRLALPNLFRDLKVRTLLDAPCGDWNWMRNVELGDIQYLGADIVPELIANNTARFANLSSGEHSQRRFEVIDLVLGPVPKADLVLCRDCLVHLSNENVLKALKNIIASGSRYLLTTTFVNQKINTDIIIGFRCVNLQLPPFSLPEPLMLIDEGSSEQADKRLGLWDLQALRK